MIALLGGMRLYLSPLGVNTSLNTSVSSYTSSGVKSILTDVFDCPGGMEPVYVMFGRSTPTKVGGEKQSHDLGYFMEAGFGACYSSWVVDSTKISSLCVSTVCTCRHVGGYVWMHNVHNYTYLYVLCIVSV